MRLIDEIQDNIDSVETCLISERGSETPNQEEIDILEEELQDLIAELAEAEIDLL